MRKSILLFVLFGLTGLGKTAYADLTQLNTLLQRNNCVACHLSDKRKYGPNMQEVSARYAGQAGAVSQLAVKIKSGGTGVWGPDMMPPQPHVSDADAQTMAKLILSLNPK